MTAGADARPPLDADLQQLLQVWMPRQRWYPAKGRGVGLRGLGTIPLPDPTGEADVAVHVVGLDSGDRFDVVQVPLTSRVQAVPGLEDALVGRLGERWLYDGPHDPAYVAALLAGLQLAPGADRPDPAHGAKVLSGEQSNTSVVVGAGSDDPTIVKVFRTLHAGANPDVEVTAALSTGGCDRVPAVRGWASGRWLGPDGTDSTGHLAVAVEFLAGSQDAWREAVAAVADGQDFSDRARDLGAATAAVHLALADTLGRTAASDHGRRALVTGLRSRVEWALSSAPSLDGFRDALADHVSRLEQLPDLPDLQRVHGDLHLGQVLHSPARGWVLLDFEGEPLRPLSERAVPDLALRDVAGMLRSFDYAATYSAGGAPAGPDDGAALQAAELWAQACRAAFCEGYAAAGGDDPANRPELLAALELDKALYEVVYETRNRPQWLHVPLHAVQRLLGSL